ncbi:uncharacterized protein PG986_000477 [Apiospora aurea]|uniref:Uncharacterized protein n=1 Tax=Apiospora aurea TaxID=335848 RepID=A0ABR1QU73_9PEZI
MSSPDTTTAAPSLPGNWVPSKAGCLNKNDWWIWSYDGPKNDARTVLGGPSQTNNCFPSTGDPTGTYAGSQCPPNYTRACPDSSVADAAVTCCPTVNTWTYGLRIFGRRDPATAVRNWIKPAAGIIRFPRPIRRRERRHRGRRWGRRASVRTSRILPLPTEAWESRQDRVADDIFPSRAGGTNRYDVSESGISGVRAERDQRRRLRRTTPDGYIRDRRRILLGYHGQARGA